MGNFEPKHWACVLGGAGFIGSNLVDELVVNGYGVRILDNLSEGRMENISRWVNPVNEMFVGGATDHEGGRVRFIRGDIRDFDTVQAAVDGCSVVFHLAAMSRIQPSITDPLLAFSQNMLGTGNVAEACRRAGVKRLVYSASSSAYGRASDELFADPQFRGLHEGLPTDCLNPYSLSKKTGEEIMEVYRTLYGLSTVSLRYFNVYGPRHQEEGSYATVIAIFRKQLRMGQRLTVVGDGEQRRDFTFVGDVVRANMMAAMNRTVHGVINVGCGQNYSINHVAAKILEQPERGESWDSRVEYIPPRLGEARWTLADNRKAAELLGWRPSVTLGQGLEVLERYETINGYPGLASASDVQSLSAKLGLTK